MGDGAKEKRQCDLHFSLQAQCCCYARRRQSRKPTRRVHPPLHRPPNSADTSTNTATPLRDNIRDMLQKSGFSDIRMLPSSFMIRAKDQQGNPVVMSVSPDSVTEISELGTSGANGPGDQRREQRRQWRVGFSIRLGGSEREAKTRIWWASMSTTHLIRTSARLRISPWALRAAHAPISCQSAASLAWARITWP